MSTNDEAVRSTNDDAASCKRSAVELGYWSDPYIQFLTKASDRKPPEINRGYYARVSGIRGLVRQFIKLTGGNCQVVNLGAGSDTMFWNLKNEGCVPSKAWIEVDFAECTSKKVYCIRSRKQLLQAIQSTDTEASFSRTDVHSSVYHLVASDLRDISAFSSALESCGIDRQVPTAFVAECVLVYMSAASSNNLVSWIAENFSTAFFVNYEQVNMGDRFGEVMIHNLQLRGCALVGVEHCMSLGTQKARFTNNGWQAAEAVDMMSVYNSLPAVDVQRIERIEMLDDRDMLTQLCEHYCLGWAVINRCVASGTRTSDSGDDSIDLGSISLDQIL